MFEITGDQIAKLKDDDLRALVALLCEAELRRRNLPSTSVTWGGSQDAADGGLDVRVTLDSSTSAAPPIPRFSTGYQVKAEDMSRARILAEMRPKGVVRDVIRDMAAQGGAYIIVSSKGSLTDVALTNRIQAMREAVQDIPHASSLHLEFFDRNRLATWVRDHAGMVLWVREKIGEPLRGWRPYDSWTFTETSDERFLIDDATRFRTADATGGSSLTVADGFAKIRGKLAQSRAIVRFVGLSGVGKTRLAQALFERDVVGDALDPSLAVYTNLGDGPDPSPIALATELATIGQRAILVVDNCPADLHASLSETCRKSSSPLSLLTIEYDIRDDQPEATDVFEIRPSSEELIQKLLEKRFPQLSHVDAQRVARLSDGNARIAVVIAGTVKNNDSIAGLNDDLLFRRLFEQRKGADDDLLLSAQVCSLVYSFHVQDQSEGDAAELRRLGQIIERNFDSMYRDVQLLKRRDLVQQRSVWRAVLPHAIANRLAKSAFEEIPSYKIDNFVKSASPRLLVSFSRRLSYLHESPHVRQRVESWLRVGGMLSDLRNFDDDRVAIFKNIAPVAPELVLSTIERSIQSVTDEEAAAVCIPFRELLWSLAYEAKYFDRCGEILIRMIVGNQQGKSREQVQDGFSGLFTLYLSGTLATLAQRIRSVEGLLMHQDDRRRAIGRAALNAMLQTSHFISFHNFEFGARSRDFGYMPNTNTEILEWYKAVLDLCVRIDATAGAAAEDVRKTMAEKLSSLWHSTDLYEEISTACRSIASRKYWPDGWLALCSIRRWQKKESASGEEQKILSLEPSLRPKSLVERTDAFLKRNAGSGYWDVDDEFENDGDYNEQLAKTQASAYELGKEIARDQKPLEGVALALVSSPSGMVFGMITKGIVEASNDPVRVWSTFSSAFAATPVLNRQAELLACLLVHLRERDNRLVQKLLDDAVEDPVLGEWFPILQSRVGADRKGVARLKKSLRVGVAPVERYRAISHSTIPLPPAEVRTIASKILRKKDGFTIALEIVWLLVARAGKEKVELSPDVIRAGREILERLDWQSDSHMDDYHLAEVAEACLHGDGGESIARKLCAGFSAASAKFITGLYNHVRLFGALLAVQAEATLDGLLLPSGARSRYLIRTRFNELEGNIFEHVPQAILLEWCDRDAKRRYPRLAAAIIPFRETSEGGKRAWTELATTLLDRAPNRIHILKEYVTQFVPRSWSGSAAAIMEVNVRLLDDIDAQKDPELMAFIMEERARFLQEIDVRRRSELTRDRIRDERFE